MSPIMVWKCVDYGHSNGLNKRGCCGTCGSQAVFLQPVPVVPVVETERVKGAI